MRVSVALVVLFVAMAGAGCGDDEASSVTATSNGAAAQGLPAPAAETREAILAAAEAGDYEQLRDVIDKEVFLSDYGFGADQPDPVSAWEELGARPLETMAALLQMRHFVRETNEGTLYQWPRLDPDSSIEDMSPAERELFLTFMSEDELADAFNPDYGYTAPRLGVLADGTWWFLILEPGP
jgi:hypothetical protein